MREDIFDFWSRIPDDATIHPDDIHVFERAPTKFELDCLPTAFTGPLRTAPIVLLFLSPGFEESDRQHARSEQGRLWYKEQRSGIGLLPTRENHESAWRWWTKTVRQFGVETDKFQDKLAILDMGAYHSRSFNDWPMLSALPSSRVAVNWAQKVLFPAAEAGERVVICMRSAAWWGLGNQARYGKSLFAPATNRRGHMQHESDAAPSAIRREVIQAVQMKVAESRTD
jgi:hypothetical protein